ncbi:MAG TPA: hypothetical protein DEA96_00930 [Leptospiraceae bacterium]|nr:hypothetical protein [Leptospiraceae bacterium]
MFPFRTIRSLRFSGRSVFLVGFAGIVLLTSSCDRLKLPPRPDNVPENAEFDRRRDVWNVVEGEQFRQYYKNGKLSTEGQTKDGKRFGRWNWYAPDGRTLTTTGVYLNGRRDGLWKHFDDSGRLYLTIEYAPEPIDPVIGSISIDYGNENGPYKRYYPDGTLEEEGSHRAGKRDGTMKRYHPDGELMVLGQYRDGKKEGKWQYYHFSGALVRIEDYTDGKLEGNVITYHANGLPYSETLYRNGEPVGPPGVQNRLEEAYEKKPYSLSPTTDTVSQHRNRL